MEELEFEDLEEEEIEEGVGDIDGCGEDRAKTLEKLKQELFSRERIN